ncbi:RNA polymerase sigma-70 factor, ECF subfamily [Evansella caseinilytica]|uniref:RNA polymerase sigma-70 factor, ECF subfamily n=1 Tax=Evansella caseinilytica TaxID=1503961 RepID=A0A1H3RAP2_9BACI|nr:sigma-70 family RNA polymerase sigma factor [Evansella caseinilytica]SDZ22706.1 RNA polymerase sigma-70 factor, ECF subfamily [Evansella caseinilytica]
MEEEVKESAVFPANTPFDKEAFLDDIMHDYGHDILRLVYTYVNNKAVAEDLTQDIFLKCYRKFDQFNYESSIKTWLYRITVNHCKDYLRSWHCRKVMINEAVISALPSKDKQVDDEVIQKSTDEQLADAVMRLPMKYREVIYLFYYEELKLEEISATLNVNINTIKSRLKRAREVLKMMVEEV